MANYLYSLTWPLLVWRTRETNESLIINDKTDKWMSVLTAIPLHCNQIRKQNQGLVDHAFLWTATTII